MPAIEVTPGSDTMTETSREIANIEKRALESPEKSATTAIEEAFNEAFPNGVPVSGDVPAPVKVKEEPLKEEKRDALKLPIPESLLKKPEAKAVEQADLETELAEQTKGMSPKASERFKAIHSRATTAEVRAKQLESELTQLKSAPPKANDGEVEALKKQVEEYDEIVKQTKLERHPKFKDAYDGEIGRQLKAAKAIAGDKLGKEVAAALESGDDEKWTDVSEKLGPMKSAQIAAISAHIEKLKIDKAEQLDNWKENYSKVEELEGKQRSAAEAQHKAAMEKAVSGVLAGVQHPEKGFEIFRKIEGNAEWNAEVDARTAKIREFATADLSPEDRATIVMQAVAAGKYQNLFQHFAQANALLLEALQKYRSGEPSFAGTETGRDPELREKMGFLDAVESDLKKLGVIQ